MIPLDAMIFGGGVAGLWALDELCRSGYSALLVETSALGRGQTVASQGILHGGLKYTLQGLFTEAADSVREMPALWRECLAGAREPKLLKTRIRADHCHLWRTDSIASRLGMIGAKFGLRVAPQAVADGDRPAALAACPGTVAKLDEQVISPASLMANFASRNLGALLKIDSETDCQFECDRPGHVRQVSLRNPLDGGWTPFRPKHVIFTAGQGNASLRQAVGLSPTVMQKRPLHMVMLRGDLPVLNGHCVDGAKTRVTITTDIDNAGQVVWQIGGQVAEVGTKLDPAQLLALAAQELVEAIPGLKLDHVEGATYRVDRAEHVTERGHRPDNLSLLEEGNVLSAWPTKLVLAPQLAARIAAVVRREHPVHSGATFLPNWQRPLVARPPWEVSVDWRRVEHPTRHASRRAA